MWVERVSIEGFRSLCGSFEFAPGLTVVVGPNEAGKSSLHEALVRLLCGFSKSDRRRSRGSSIRERSAPWGDRQHALSGRLRDGDRYYDIGWDFESHQLDLTDERGRDLSQEAFARGDDDGLCSYFFGVGLDDFRQVCCVDQDALLGVRQSPSLGVALQEAVANVAGDVAVEDAVARLNDFLRVVIGARVDTLKPSPTGRLSALALERDGLLRDLAASDETRERLAGVSAEGAKLRHAHKEKLDEREALRQQQLLSEETKLEVRLAEALRLDRVAANRPTDPKLADVAVDAVKVARDRLGDLGNKIDAAVREADAANSDVEQLEVEQRRLVPLVDGLELYAGLDVSRQAEIQSASVALAELAVGDDGPPEIPPRDPMLAAYREQRVALLAQKQGSQNSQLRHISWLALVVATLGLAYLIRKLVRRWRRSRMEPPTDRLRMFGASSLEELDRRCKEEDERVARAEARAEAHVERQLDLTSRREVLAGAAGEALDAARVPAAPLEERISAYLNGCQRHGELIQRRAELERVRRELAEARRPAEEVARLQRDREAAEGALRAAYAAVGVEEASLTDAGRRFDDLLTSSAKDRALAQEAEAAQTALKSLLGDETAEALAAKRDGFHRQLEEHVALHGVISSTPGDPAQLAENLAETEDTLRDEAARLAELDTEARRLEEEMGDPALLKERLAAVDAERERLLLARDAVALARDVLSESADELSREFAPHLNEALRRNLARITAGRYAEARVDSDLTVKVVVPETGQVVSADDLSRATKDQIFLVQRLEIARLLAPTKGVAPLLFDDPFAHYDEYRTRHGLEILAETASIRQVILFSEDPAIARIASEVSTDCRIIELPAPPAGEAVALKGDEASR